MSSNLLRKSAITVGAVGTYFSTVYFVYNFGPQLFTNSPCPHCGERHSYTDSHSQTNDSKHGDNTKSTSTFSYETDPKRIKTFNRIAQAYDDEISREEKFMGTILLRRWMVYFHAYGKVMEVGAGTGRNVTYYHPKKEGGNVDSVVLTDTSDQMLLKAREKIKLMEEKKKNSIWRSIQESLKMINVVDDKAIDESGDEDYEKKDNFFSMFVADASKLTSYYPNNSFDTIVDTMGVCSFDNPVETLQEIQRICKPNGKILLLEHGRSQTWTGMNKFLDDNKERHAMNWGCVWNRDIEAIVRQSGLEIESIWKWHFGTTYYVICRPGKWKCEEENDLNIESLTKQ